MALIIFLHIVGWLYTCGIHHGNKEYIRKHGTEKQSANIDLGGQLQYVILFFIWPHYLGSNK